MAGLDGAPAEKIAVREASIGLFAPRQAAGPWMPRAASPGSRDAPARMRATGGRPASRTSRTLPIGVTDRPELTVTKVTRCGSFWRRGRARAGCWICPKGKLKKLNVRHARESPGGDAAGGYMPEPVARAVDLVVFAMLDTLFNRLGVARAPLGPAFRLSVRGKVLHGRSSSGSRPSIASGRL